MERSVSKSRLHGLQFIIVLMGCVLVSSPVLAAVTNGGFETGDFTGWTTTGDANIETSSFGSGPTEGLFQALITTAGGISDAALEGFLGLAAGALDASGNGDATEGSAFKQTFSANAGDELSFNWNHLTNEATPSFFNDFSFVSINPLFTLANTSYSPYLSTSTPFSEETGFQTFSYIIPATGNYTLGFGVVDVGDEVVDSGLLVDNVKLTSTEIPEPTSLLLVSLGALGLLPRKKIKSV